MQSWSGTHVAGSSATMPSRTLSRHISSLPMPPLHRKPCLSGPILPRCAELLKPIFAIALSADVLRSRGGKLIGGALLSPTKDAGARDPPSTTLSRAVSISPCRSPFGQAANNTARLHSALGYSFSPVRFEAQHARQMVNQRCESIHSKGRGPKREQYRGPFDRMCAFTHLRTRFSAGLNESVRGAKTRMRQTTLCVPLEVKPESCSRLSALLEELRRQEDKGDAGRTLESSAPENFARVKRDIPSCTSCR